jgi:hypothetical protein
MIRPGVATSVNIRAYHYRDASRSTFQPEVPRLTTIPPTERHRTAQMLTGTASPRPRRRSPALEVMPSNLDTAGDLLSGSECSSPASSPIQENISAFRPESPGRARHESNEEPHSSSIGVEPTGILQQSLNQMSEPHLAKQYIAEDAKVECYSSVIPREEEKTIRDFQQDFDDLLASCSHYEIRIDRISACGEDVAAFGHFAHANSLSGLPRDAHFSIWASVDVSRARIVRFRWMDQVVRPGDFCANGPRQDVVAVVIAHGI